MSKIKIYGVDEYLNPIKARLSDIIHSCVVDALSFPKDKRAHQFFPMTAADFHFPGSSTAKYTVVEISMFEDRSVETKKQLIRLLFERVCSQLELKANELEISITETPKHNWGFRGLPGDEVALNYKVEV